MFATKYETIIDELRVKQDKVSRDKNTCETCQETLVNHNYMMVCKSCGLVSHYLSVAPWIESIHLTRKTVHTYSG